MNVKGIFKRQKEESFSRKEKLSEVFFIIITLIVSTFAIASLIAASSAIVKAADTNTTTTSTPIFSVCCEKTKSGAYCQNDLPENCDSSFKINPTSCDSTSYCKLGCCYDSTEGVCAENTPLRVCQAKNGTYDSSATCDISQCQLGCCVLGGDANLVTLTRCKKLASYYGLQVDFRSNIKSEIECIDIAQAQDKGACVFLRDNEKTCRFATRSECKSIGNGTIFNKDFLCSAEELGTNCAKQHHTGCVSGKEEVYWFDSCNNPENIYDADKVKSWNSGKVLSKEQSCGAGEANTNDKDCGNCQYFSGSMCGSARAGKDATPTFGDYICRDLNCKNTYDGTNRKHGESWCVYDGIVGIGRDVVGSRYWRHICIAGEEKLEPCADWRQEVCAIGTVNTSLGTFTESACLANRFRECIDITLKMNNELNKQGITDIDKKQIKDKYKNDCGNITDCYWKEVWNKKVPVCLPNYPSGLDLGTETKGTSGEAFCSIASANCTIIEVKGIDLKWECKANCECKTDAWVQEMNDFCTSLGDCGAKSNIVGKVTTDGVSITGNYHPKLTQTYLSKLSSYATSKTSVSTTGKAIDLVDELRLRYQPKSMQQIINDKLNSGTSLIPLAAAVKGTPVVAQSAKNKILGSIKNFFDKNIVNNPVTHVAAAAIAAYLIAKILRLDNKNAMIVAVLASIAGKLIPLWKTGTFHYIGSVMVWAFVIAIILKLLGVGKKREKQVNFNCMPWQPPIGGADCEKCNKDPMKPCSDYRCASLGASCSLLNKGTGNETCVWLNKNDVNAPVITPWKEVLTKGHSYSQVKPCPPGPGCWKITGQGKGGCIKAFTPLIWGIQTNEPSQCKIDYNHTSKFDDMQYYFGESNLYLYNHSVAMSLPAPNSVSGTNNAAGNVSAPELKNDGNYTLFIRCRDGNGRTTEGEFAVQFCVESGPDTTPSEIVRTSLENGAPIVYGATSTPLDIFVNEPSECKWSRTDQDFDHMTHSFGCATSIESMENDFTYKCSTTLTEIADGQTNTYYFRCKDQPWLAGKNESDRNVNKQSYIFKLQGTRSLNITSVGPNGTIYSGFEPFTVTLRATTANGADGGNAKCSYSDAGYSNMIEFFTTGTDTHEQKLDLLAGSYKYYLQCIDAAGNIDRNYTSFTIAIDKLAPQIARAYKDGELMKIITNEDSECAYGIKSCDFEFATATQMPVANSTEHTAIWKTDTNYYIKCKDVYGNLPSGCSIVVHGYDIGASE
ncbi:hypothetical protein HZA33_04805 [Candidatus Pacearchaeota archaeon]|nr:hypothetical protein [Candidatus Pacearchaeota archaeon]